MSVAFVHEAPAQGLHTDAKLGFKIKAPDGFDKVPLKPDEEWIAARWISQRAYYQNDKSGFSVDHKPELNVIAFPSDKVKEKVDVQKTGTGNTSVEVISIKNPYKDYRDYLKRTYNDGGFFIAKEDKAEVEGIPVETLEIKVEKMTFGGPRKIVTWIFKQDDADFAVQIEVVENAWPKLKGDILSCFRSFRRIPKEGGGATTHAINPADIFEHDEDLTTAQRTARRRDSEAKTIEKFSKDLPDGWSAKKYGRLFVISHVDEKYAAKVAESGNAVLDFLDANFGYIGPGEYVRAPIVRICKDYDEERVYHKGSGWTFDREITTSKDSGGFSSSSNEVTSGCFEHWLRERDNDVYMEMPRWLEMGLDRAFSRARAKGGKLEFTNDSWERVGVSQQVHSGKLSDFKDLVQMDPEKLWNERNKDDECAAAARFLVTGPKKAKDALRAYVGAVQKIADLDKERRKAEQAAKKPDAKPKTLEEEDAKFKAANTEQRDSQKKHLEEVYNAAFGTWSDADWKSFQAAYEKSFG